MYGKAAIDTIVGVTEYAKGSLILYGMNFYKASFLWDGNVMDIPVPKYI